MSFHLGGQVRTGLCQLQRLALGLAVLGCACGGGGGGSSSGSNNNGNGTPPNIQISIKPETATLDPQGTQQFTATVTGTTDTSVSWQVIEGDGGSVDSTGLYQAPTAKGTYHLMVVSGANSNVIAEAIISVPNSTGNGTIGIH